MISRTRTVFLAISIVCAYVVWGALISLQPPFYPTEAEKKGATPAQYGFVFGIANLAAFISAPFFGVYGTKIGAKILYNFGALLQALAGIAFAFLEYVDNTAAFLGLSYLLRFLDGVADAASWNSVVSILMVMYPSKVSTVMSWTEMLFGFGYMIGPALGSALYSIGGFPLPFLSVGTFGLLVAIALYFVVPDVQANANDSPDDNRKVLNLRGIAKSPSILLPYLDNFFCFCGNGMIESMLEPHLKRKAGATQADVGVTFLILGGVYMLSSPIGGLICDRLKYPTMVSIVGNTSMAIAFLFLGPVPFIPVETQLSIIQGMVGLVGFGYALVMVSSFGRAQSAALSLGYADDLNTYIMISGMWSASFYIGNFIGPTAAGFLVDAYGFEWTTVVFFSLYGFILLVDIFELSFNVKKTKEALSYDKMEKRETQNNNNEINDEKLPLLESNR